MTTEQDSPPGVTVFEPGADAFAARLREMDVALSGAETRASRLIEYDQRTRSFAVPLFLILFFLGFGGFFSFVAFTDEEDASLLLLFMLWGIFGALIVFGLYLLHNEFYQRRWFLLSPVGIAEFRYRVLERLPRTSRMDEADMDGVVLEELSNAAGKAVHIRLKDGRKRMLVSDVSTERATFLYDMLKRRYCDDP